MYSTRTHVNVHIPNGHTREEKPASGQNSGRQLGELNGPRALRNGLPLLHENPRTEVGEEVHVVLIQNPGYFSCLLGSAGICVIVVRDRRIRAID